MSTTLKQVRQQAGQLVRRDAARLAPGLGWFSLALGLTELLAPRLLAHALGMRGRETLLQAYGLREIAAGAGLLLSRRQAPWVWARVAGDALDIATLLAHARPSNPRPAGLAVGLAAVAGVTALDIACAKALSRAPAAAPRDYSDRVGMPLPVDQMRGAARREAKPVEAPQIAQ
jgi:hypothetical protein